MEPLICQSCGFSFSYKFRGTNRDLSKNDDFCKDCFEHGKFTDPHLTIQDQERQLLDMAREHDGINIEEARQIIKSLPDLKRWKMTHIL